MSGISSNTSSMSSRPLFTGTPAVVPLVEHLIATYKNAFEQALKDVTKEEEQKVKDRAANSQTGWSSLSDKLSVTYDDAAGSLKYHINGGAEDIYKASVLEYGDEKNAPTALLRSSALESRDGFNQQVVARAYSIIRKTFK